VERFAFSCIWEITPNADILSTKFHKSIIKSKAAMTYEQAQNKIDDPNDHDSLAVSLRGLLGLSKILKRRRIENGALLLASSEVRFNVDRYVSICHDSGTYLGLAECSAFSWIFFFKC
jgi:exosome complex exonuclease DIS3/RRP44